MAATPAQDAALAAITSAVSTLRASLDTPPPAPGYTVTATPSPVSEGGTVTFAVSGPAGAVVAYMLEGISSADVTVPLVGTLTLDASGAGSLVVGVVAVTVIRAISAARELQSDIAVAQGHATSVNMAALSDDLPVVRESALALVEVTDGPVWQVLSRIPWLGTTTTSVAALGQTAAAVSAAGMETRPILASLTAGANCAS